MAKHPVPKKKTSKARGSRRYKAYQNKARVRLANSVQLSKCEKCSATIRAHHACGECGFYRGKDLRENLTQPEAKAAKTEKVETIKAD